jgi:hypothetical protein
MRTATRDAEDQLIGWVAPYIRYLADHMNLADWKFRVVLGDLLDSLATVSVVPNRQFATITVGDGFFGATEHDQRHGLVHDLVHLHLEPSRRTVDNVEPTVTQPTFQVLKGCHDDSLEGAADRLACAIAMGLLMPGAWVEQQGKK